MRFAGKVGFADTKDTSPGVWEETFVEKQYYGDVLSAPRRLDASQDTTNYDVNVSNRISIVADPFARTHYFAIRYVYWQGAAWKVSSVEIQYPRLILSIGGLWTHDKT